MKLGYKRKTFEEWLAELTAEAKDKAKVDPIFADEDYDGPVAQQMLSLLAKNMVDYEATLVDLLGLEDV